MIHERQSFSLCALHTINNILQVEGRQRVTKKHLDNICQELAPGKRFLNPHRAWSRLGDYDANVLILALQRRGLVVNWFDTRVDVQTIHLSGIVGIVCNREIKRMFGTSTTRHWFALREVGGVFYDLDSMHERPVAFENDKAIHKFLKAHIASKGLLFLVKSSNSHAPATDNPSADQAGLKIVEECNEGGRLTEDSQRPIKEDKCDDIACDDGSGSVSEDRSLTRTGTNTSTSTSTRTSPTTLVALGKVVNSALLSEHPVPRI